MTDFLNNFHSPKSLNTCWEGGCGAGAGALKESFVVDMTYSSCIMVKRRQCFSWSKIVLLGTLPTSKKWG